MIDLTDSRFGDLTVLHREILFPGDPQKRGSHWICRCVCGNTTRVKGGDLQRGFSRSCGCGKRKAQRARYDLTGKSYGIFTVIRGVDPPLWAEGRGRGRYWVVSCSCGKEMPALPRYSLRNLVSKGCSHGKSAPDPAGGDDTKTRSRKSKRGPEVSPPYVPPVVENKKDLSSFQTKVHPNPDKDVTGKKYGAWTVTRYLGLLDGSEDAPKYVSWAATCKCGREKIVKSNNLHGLARRDKTGKKYGTWTVVSHEAHPSGDRCGDWRVVCECGQEKSVPTKDLPTLLKQPCPHGAGALSKSARAHKEKRGKLPVKGQKRGG